MTTRTSQKDAKSQMDKFKDAAHELEADESEKRWEKRLKKIVKLSKKDSKPN